MSLSPALIDAMVASGCSVEQMAAVMKAALAEEEARRAEKRAKDAERQRKHRSKGEMSRNVTVTTCDNRDAVSPNDYISNPLPLSPSANADAPLSDFSDRVMEDWNREIAGSPLPPAKRMTPARRKALTARVREHGEDAVLVAIRGMVGSDFHSGRSGKWTEGDLGWLLKPENFAKMLERAEQAQANKPASKPSPAGGTLFARLQAGEITQAEFEAERSRLTRPAQPPPTHRERPQSGSIAQFIPDIRGNA